MFHEKPSFSLLSHTVTFYSRHALNEGDHKQREIKALRRDLDKKDDDLGETTRLHDAVARENKRVQDDLVTMTSENQVSKIFCDQAVNERILKTCLLS